MHPTGGLRLNSSHIKFDPHSIRNVGAPERKLSAAKTGSALEPAVRRLFANAAPGLLNLFGSAPKRFLKPSPASLLHSFAELLHHRHPKPASNRPKPHFIPGALIPNPTAGTYQFLLSRIKTPQLPETEASPLFVKDEGFDSYSTQLAFESRLNTALCCDVLLDSNANLDRHILSV